MMKLTRFWQQVDGDRDFAAYGGTFGRLDGDSIELRKFQPTREYVGDKEAVEVGFPFWSKTAAFDPSDLDPSLAENRQALQYIGCEDEDATPLTIACARLDYGFGEESAAGWADDVARRMPRRIVRALRAEDRDFRRMLKERSK